MSSRLVEPAMRTRSPNYHDDTSKRPPPSPSNKAPPPKKLDARSRPVSEEPSSPTPKANTFSQPSETSAESCTDKSSSKRVVVDLSTFGQILDLDDDGKHEFSRSMVNDYLDQAESTMKNMDDSFSKKELTSLGEHGHYLKGSSAALGVVQVQAICEKIQHLGNRLDPDKEPLSKDNMLTMEDALAKIKPLLARVKEEYAAAAKWLNEYYENGGP